MRSRASRNSSTFHIIAWRRWITAAMLLSLSISAAAAPTLTISANPPSVTNGSPSILTWSSTEVASCAASGTWSGVKATSGSQNVTAPNGLNAYALSCRGPAGSASNSVIIGAGTTPPALYALNVSVSGSGTVTSNPSGIACGATCSASYPSGAAVALSAAPATGYTFSGWSGACGGMDACVVAMTQARSVAATFSPSSDTTIANGAVTLTGSGFGAKSVVTPLRWVDHEASAVGTVAHSAGYVRANNASDFGSPPLISDARAYGGLKSLSATLRVQGSAGDGTIYEYFPSIGFNGFATEVLYQAYWLYIEQTQGTPTTFRLYKLGRMGETGPGGSTDWYSTPPKWVTTANGITATGTAGSDDATRLEDGTEGSRDGATAPAEQRLRLGQWLFVEHEYKLSTPNVADGYARYRVNGVAIHNFTNVITRQQAVSRIRQSYILNGYDYYGGVEYKIYVDDTYVDNTLQRLVLTDAANHANSTRWALLVPTSWTDTQIVAQWRSPGFSSGQIAWIHVIDATGASVIQRQITIP